ncbi:WhiB family transcriptional regulator [Leifsonia poae]|uniref:WhiB family transcriptional regulator n=1 Tax=Leifsonia poae TaxID=110933 RepID=UPI001CC116C3|nr:WhiB family transcriptional regulator [Leifsonia poae]
MSPDDAWDALNAALTRTVPPCDGKALFTVDRPTPAQRAACAAVCARCPAADLCDTYATTAKVESGFWAGHSYTFKGRK